MQTDLARQLCTTTSPQKMILFVNAYSMKEKERLGISSRMVLFMKIGHKCPNAEKCENGTEILLKSPPHCAGCKERSDGIASLRASKTSRSAERGRRRQNLRYPVKSHSQKRQIIADFCRFLLALLTSRRKNRHLEGFYLLTLPPQDRFLCFSGAI